MTPPRPLQFPAGNTPRTWLITAGASPIGLKLTRALLTHGDNVVLGAKPEDLIYGKHATRSAADRRAEDFGRFISEEVERMGAGVRERVRVVGLDGRCEASFYIFCHLFIFLYLSYA